MATTKGRKTTAKSRKKKTDEVVEAPVVESPDEEVIEPVAEDESAQEELPSAPILEETVAIEHASETVVEEKVEAAPEAVVEAAPEAAVEEKEPPPLAPEFKAAEPAPTTTAQPHIISIGSEVVMPSGKRGRVVGLSPKGRFQVSKLSSPKKIYLYTASELVLAK
jgi:hypothetical protein